MIDLNLGDQRQAVHQSGHAHICHQDIGFGMPRQDVQGFGAVSCLQHQKSLILKGCDRRHADEDFIFHDQDCLAECGVPHVSISPENPQRSVFPGNSIF